MPVVDYAVVLADLERRRAELDAAIAAVAVLAGLPVHQVPREEAHVEPAREPARRRQATRPREVAARPTDAQPESAIRAALAHGHQTAQAIAISTKVPDWKVREVLRRLKESGAVTTSGATKTLRYHLAQ